VEDRAGEGRSGGDELEGEGEHLRQAGMMSLLLCIVVHSNDMLIFGVFR